MTRDEIDQEFDRFFEFPSRDRGTVTSVSARLFARHIAEIVAGRMAETEAAGSEFICVKCGLRKGGRPKSECPF